MKSWRCCKCNFYCIKIINYRPVLTSEVILVTIQYLIHDMSIS